MERMPILFLLTCSLLLLTKTPTEARSILCNEGERSTLLSLRSELVFDSLRSTKLVAWNSHNDCCRWDGIECDRIGRVIGLELDYDAISSGINGSSSLFRLTNLKKLNLAGNSLDERIQIPKEMGRLTSLTELDLSRVGFSGLIPSTFTELRKLAVVDLSENFLTGPVPSLFSELRELVSLDLSDNMFTTPIPSFRKCIKLKNLNLSSNRLEGSLSNSQFKGLPALQLLDLSHNRFSGQIPHSIFRLPSLHHLSLSYNQFRGQINEFPFAKLVYISYLDVSHNELVGMIPTRRQLQTFLKSSFKGNLGLCGAPTKISCGHHTWPPEEGLDVERSDDDDDDEEEEEIGWSYVSASLRFAVVLGVILWASMCNQTFILMSRRVLSILVD